MALSGSVQIGKVIIINANSLNHCVLVMPTSLFFIYSFTSFWLNLLQAFKAHIFFVSLLTYVNKYKSI